MLLTGTVSSSEEKDAWRRRGTNVDVISKLPAGVCRSSKTAGLPARPSACRKSRTPNLRHALIASHLIAH